MKTLHVPVELLGTSGDLARTGTPHQFLARLEASIETMGLAEPLKVAEVLQESGPSQYVIVDGRLRWEAIQRIRQRDANRFRQVPVYVVEFERRFEIRFQTDIYQDLLPSQLAELVEHLHVNEGVAKRDIAAYIGVSQATLRNYTGLWRLVQRGGLSASVVQLMDAGVLPASNPYAWLRLTDHGVRQVIELHLADGATAEEWIAERLRAGSSGERRLPLKIVEILTGSLPPECYRGDSETRAMKRGLGERRRDEGVARPAAARSIRHLRAVKRSSSDPVVAVAAGALEEYLR